MFRHLAIASLAALGTLVPNTAQAQIVVSIPVPVVRPHHHHHTYRVEYRVSVWEERAFCDYAEARRYERLKLLDGFDAQLVRIGPDWQVRYRVAVWQTYELASRA